MTETETETREPVDILIDDIAALSEQANYVENRADEYLKQWRKYVDENWSSLHYRSQLGIDCDIRPGSYLALDLDRSNSDWLVFEGTDYGDRISASIPVAWIKDPVAWRLEFDAVRGAKAEQERVRTRAERLAAATEAIQKATALKLQIEAEIADEHS